MKLLRKSVIGEDAVKAYETFQYAEGESDDKLADVRRSSRSVVILDTTR